MKNIIEAIILNGNFRDENILLQRIPLNAFNFQLDWHLQ
jgi:hypothetical protein